MKHKQTWLLIAALLAFLTPPAFVLAEDAGKPTNFVEVGGAGMAVDDEVNRVNEYTVIRDDDGANPYIKARVEGGGDGVHLDLDASRMSQRDQDYNLEADFSRAFKFDAGYQTYKHWLSHDQLDYMRATMKTDAQTRATGANGPDDPGSANPAVYSEDLVPGEDFFLIHRKWEAEGKVTIPDVPNIALKAGYRREQREGTEQVFGISHCSACHVEGSAKDIDEETTDITLGASGQFGLVTVDYEYLTRDFDDSSADVYRDYLLAAKPEDGLLVPGDFNNRLLFDQNNDDVLYADTPESEKDSHTVKARVDLTSNTIVSATYINADIDSDKQDDVGRTLSKNHLSTDYDSYSMRASTRLGNWRLSGYGRHEKIDSSDNQITFLEINGDPVLDVPDASGSRSTYIREWESEEARDINTIGANAVYRITTGTSVRLGYEYEEIDRDIDEAQDTDTHKVTASLRTRPMKGMNARVQYTYENIDDPFLNPHGNKGPIDEDFVYESDPKRWYGVDYYTKREAEATSLPEDVHDVKGTLTWTPSARYSVTVYARYRYEENDLNFNTYEKDVISPGFSVWWAPLNELNLTMA
ncbi:MAG: MtrB/PioB family outer membrane beta-barrel protein, partial [Deltaproteobacteria bacterium]|nr:MtrB/PioB family outer membrane beta-barrel protein [Deltaproteobacteria bacterium]